MDRIVATRGARIYVREEGSGNGTPVLFIHGWPDNHHTWDFQIQAMAADRKVYALDIPGAGKSPALHHEREYHSENMAEIFAAVIRELVGKEGRVHLVAHDWGAVISWVLISRTELAANITSYTAISGPHPAEAREYLINMVRSGNFRDFFWQISKSWYILFFQLPVLPELAIRMFTGVAKTFLLRSADIPGDDPMHELTHQEIIDSSVKMIPLYRQLLTGRPVSRPGWITLPIQVLIPRLDLALSPDLYNSVPQFCQDARMVYYNANHWVHRQMADKVNADLKAFWASVEASAELAVK